MHSFTSYKPIDTCVYLSRKGKKRSVTEHQTGKSSPKHSTEPLFCGISINIQLALTRRWRRTRRAKWALHIDVSVPTWLCLYTQYIPPKHHNFPTITANKLAKVWEEHIGQSRWIMLKAIYNRCVLLCSTLTLADDKVIILRFPP